MEEKKSFAKKSDYLIITIVAIIAAFFALWFYMPMGNSPSGENIAVVTINSEEIMRIDLGHYYGEAERISLMEEYGVPVNFLLEEGSIRFIDVTCPDHLCELYGAISHEYDIAVCMPNLTAVTIEATTEK